MDCDLLGRVGLWVIVEWPYFHSLWLGVSVVGPLKKPVVEFWLRAVLKCQTDWIHGKLVWMRPTACVGGSVRGSDGEQQRLVRPTHTLGQWVSAGGTPTPTLWRTLGNVWRWFWLSYWNREQFYWHLLGRGQGSCRVLQHTKQSLRQKHCLAWNVNSAGVEKPLELRNPVLDLLLSVVSREIN